MDKRRNMDYKLFLLSWLIFATTVIYWNVAIHKDEEPVSACHGAEIKVYYDRNMCTKCKLFCEVKNEKKQD